MTKEQFIENTCLYHLQNLNGREDDEEIFRMGVESAYDEFQELKKETKPDIGVQSERLSSYSKMSNIQLRAYSEANKMLINQCEPDLETIQSFIFHWGHCPLMLKTPFKDCEGKPIYDGDIIGDWTEMDGEMKLTLRQVFFCEHKGQWMLDISAMQDKGYAFPLFLELKEYDFKVMGNIYKPVSEVGVPFDGAQGDGKE